MTSVLNTSGLTTPNTPAATPAATSTTAATIERVMTEGLATVRADGVFGRPIERGGTTVIPCAEIMVGMGLGGGSGTGPAQQQGKKKAQAAETQAEAQATELAGGEGYGGGGGGRARPIAVIVVTADGVRVQPVFDFTRIALAGMTTGAFMAFWITRLASGTRGRSVKPPSFGRLARTIRG